MSTAFTRALRHVAAQPNVRVEQTFTWCVAEVARPRREAAAIPHLPRSSALRARPSAGIDRVSLLARAQRHAAASPRLSHSSALRARQCSGIDRVSLPTGTRRHAAASPRLPRSSALRAWLRLGADRVRLLARAQRRVSADWPFILWGLTRRHAHGGCS